MNKWAHLMVLAGRSLLLVGLLGLGSAISPALAKIARVRDIRVGQAPVAVAVNPLTNRIYVANSESATISVLEGAAQRIVATVPVDPKPVAIAVNPRLNRYYVVSQERGTVWVMNGSDNSVLRVDQTGEQSSAVVVDPTTGDAYIASRHQVAIVASNDNGTQRFIALPFDGQSAPLGTVLNSAANRLYVADSLDSQIAVIDTVQQAVIHVIQLESSSDPFAMAVNARLGRLYIASFVRDQILAFDTQGVHLQRVSLVGSHPSGLAVGAGGRLYVSEGGGFGIYYPNGLNNTVAVLDDTTLRVLRRVKVASGPTGIAVNPTTGRVYVASSETNSVSVL